MNDESASSERLRTHPSERFESPAQLFQLDQEFARLPEQSTQGHGHMQKTLYRRGGCTTAIFEFEAGAALREHKVDGEAIIHVVRGRVDVHTPAGDFELAPATMLCLAPGVAHDLVASEASQVILHVMLQGE